ncbi:hypothetical protein NUW54_g13200 [Trametes sanguinea]|uniref:Uncharacterized protein n=1 Tax=Trametes sanguinea TaxID=158606 RepID=A0ACC1MP96_9APHY|nr:hypothetical protein NUW54_g13200 [Trametes sanguinea]
MGKVAACKGPNSAACASQVDLLLNLPVVLNCALEDAAVHPHLACNSWTLPRAHPALSPHNVSSSLWHLTGLTPSILNNRVRLRPCASTSLDPSAVDPARLHLLPLDFTSEESIASAADALACALPKDAHSYIRVAFFLAGVLYPERQSACGSGAEEHRGDLPAQRYRPPAPHQAFLSLPASIEQRAERRELRRVPSRSWYSYRASKAALNQVIRTFDLHLQAKKLPAISVGVHPGTVKTDLSKAFWSSVKPDKLFEPAYAAERLAEVVKALGRVQRGKVWDWKGEEVKP